MEFLFIKLRDMASLVTFMQNQEDIVSLSTKMCENLDFFCFFFAKIWAQIN